MGAAELPEPIAEGTLASRPFAHLLLYVLQQRMNGTLVIWPEEGAGAPKRGQDRVRFVEGKPVAGRFVQRGSSVERSMLPLFTRVNAPYAFYEADLVGSGDGVLESNVEPLELITASLRGAARDDAIDAVLRRLGQLKLRIRTGANLEALGLGDKEKQFVELIRAEPTDAADLIQTSGNERVARRLLYLLTITRCIEPFTPSDDNGREVTGQHRSPGATTGRHRAITGPHEAVRVRRHSSSPAMRASTPPGRFSSRPGARTSERPGRVSSRPGSDRARRISSRPGGSGEFVGAPPPPPPELSDELTQRWKEVADYVVAVDSMNYFEMLEITKNDMGQAVRDAYFEKAKKWHPDRLPPELMPMREFADVIFYHLTKAKDTLTDAGKRKDYIKSVEAGGGTPESARHVNAVVESAMAMQRAEVFLKRHDWQGALELAEEAAELNPEDADAMAMKAWCLFQISRGKPPFDEQLDLLEAAIERNENHEKAHYYKGMVLKRKGDDKQALRCFRRVININPRHTEAMREVRISNMRKKKDDGGFLSKLFGGGDKK
jgi:curved DNA-binding protein CbpA